MTTAKQKNQLASLACKALKEYYGFGPSKNQIVLLEGSFDSSSCEQLLFTVRGKGFEYDQEGILEVVNSLGASFKQIKVLPRLAGYRVFGNKQGEYNYGDKFEPNWEMVKTAQEIEKYYDALDKQGAGHFSIWNDDSDISKIHVRFFKGGKHMIFDALADDWQATKKEIN